MSQMKKNLLKSSEFSEHEEWEEKEHQKKDEFHGDGEKRKNMAMSGLGMVRDIQERHKKTLQTKGIGHSREPKKPTWKDSDKDN